MNANDSSCHFDSEISSLFSRIWTCIEIVYVQYICRSTHSNLSLALELKPETLFFYIKLKNKTNLNNEAFKTKQKKTQIPYNTRAIEDSDGKRENAIQNESDEEADKCAPRAFYINTKGTHLIGIIKIIRHSGDKLSFQVFVIVVCIIATFCVWGRCKYKVSLSSDANCFVCQRTIHSQYSVAFHLLLAQ